MGQQCNNIYNYMQNKDQRKGQKRIEGGVSRYGSGVTAVTLCKSC